MGVLPARGNLGVGRPDAMVAAARESPPTTHVMNGAKFKRFLRIVAGLDVDKQDIKRYSDFISHKLYDLLLRCEAFAKA
jgi:hypothetical protein